MALNAPIEFWILLIGEGSAESNQRAEALALPAHGWLQNAPWSEQSSRKLWAESIKVAEIPSKDLLGIRIQSTCRNESVVDGPARNLV